VTVSPSHEAKATVREEAGWTDDVCGECGGKVESHMPKATDNHPALCKGCSDLWYPPGGSLEELESGE
jgi:hypothetical protein